MDIINYSRPTLQTAEEVARASRNATEQSWHFPGGDVRLVTPAPHPTIIFDENLPNGLRFTAFSEFPERYDSVAVQRLQQEMAIQQAEELLHELQDRRGGSLTGQKNHEADVAAYMYEQGVPLSTEYLIRYEQRMEWYAQLHPENAAEMHSFREVWGGA